MKFFFNVFILFVPLTIQAFTVKAFEDVDLLSYSLEDLLSMKVSTVSKQEQSLDESPAFVEIVTQDDIKRRGYKDLSYLLDDIAGVQVTRTFGDNYFNTLWRGVRHTVGSSYLILIDGIKFNHLYNNETEILATFPLSFIKQIEIVHGPASVAYGNDAVVGIINVITNKDSSNGEAFIQLNENDNQVVDFSTFIAIKDYQLRITARYDQGNLDMSNSNEYRWTDPELLSNNDIWGGFSEQFGDASSEHKNKALSISLLDKDTEITMQYNELATGYGYQYTFDHSLPNPGLWYESEYSIHWQELFNINEEMTIKTLLRYRSSNIDNDSLFIDGFLVYNPETNANQRLVEASYWESTNSSWTGLSELNWQINNKLNLVAGIEYEAKDLQKAYNINYGPLLPPELIDSNYDFPSPPTHDTVPNNKIDTDQSGVYILSQYQLDAYEPELKHALHFGLRSDKHSEFGLETTIRAGYVSQWKKTTLKLFYGQAYQEPSARLLYGGWQGSGSDPKLKPRNADTFEFNINYKMTNLLLSSNYFHMKSKNLFNTTDIGAINLGKGLVNGGDVRIKYQSSLRAVSNISLWTTLSWLNSKEQYINEHKQLQWGEVGDLADYTIHAGAYLTFNENWQLNLRGRYYGDRVTVKTNELENISSFTTIDANIIYRPTRLKKLTLALNISNLFNQGYFHPGVRSASASTTNFGDIDENGVWIGSESFYNAQIPQPSREIGLTAYWRFN